MTVTVSFDAIALFAVAWYLKSFHSGFRAFFDQCWIVVFATQAVTVLVTDLSCFETLTVLFEAPRFLAGARFFLVGSGKLVGFVVWAAWSFIAQIANVLFVLFLGFLLWNAQVVVCFGLAWLFIGLLVFDPFLFITIDEKLRMVFLDQWWVVLAKEGSHRRLLFK